MEDIDTELITLLCTKAGMLMEDHSALALTVGSEAADEQRAALRELAQTAEKLNAVIAAAQSLSE